MVNVFKRLFRRLKLWRLTDAPADFGKHIVPQDGGAIRDGVDYSMPAPYPGHVVALDGPDTQSEFLTEASAFTASQSFRFQFDTPQRSGADLPYMPSPTDPLKEDNWSQRKMKLANFHNAFLYNPMANSALRYYADLVLGQSGFNLACKNKDVEEVLEDFICNPDNAIRERERQFMTSLPLDGELFLRYFKGSDGTTIMVPLRPWDCEFIDTDWDFFKRVNFYQFQFLKRPGDNPMRGTEYERVQIPADQIQHVAINHLPYELRGRSMLEPVMPWLRAYKEFLENRARQNHWRTALLWLVQVANASAAQVSAVLQRWSRPPSPGTVAVESESTTVTPLVNPSGANEANEDGRQIKLMILSCFHLPEYFFADGYNANLATATAQQLPALAMFESFQTLLIEQVWTPMFKRVLQNAIDAGLLPETCEEQDADGDPVYEDPPPPNPNAPKPPMPMMMQPPQMPAMPTNGNGAMQPDMPMQPAMPMMDMPKPPARKIKMCDCLECFEITYAPVAKVDKLPQAQALVIAEQQGWSSKKTSQVEFGLDPAIENKQIAREEETDRMKAAQGMSAPSVNSMSNPTPPTDPNAIPGEGQGATVTPLKTRV